MSSNRFAFQLQQVLSSVTTSVVFEDNTCSIIMNYFYFYSRSVAVNFVVVQKELKFLSKNKSGGKLTEYNCLHFFIFA